MHKELSTTTCIVLFCLGLSFPVPSLSKASIRSQSFLAPNSPFNDPWQTWVLLTVRGGRDEDEESAKDVKTGSSATTKPKSDKKKSAFRLLHEARDEAISLASARSVEDATEKAENNSSTLERYKENHDETQIGNEVREDDARRILVGGALTMTKPSPRRKSSELKGVPSSVEIDVNRVSPLSSRLIEESDAEEYDDDEDEAEADSIDNESFEIETPVVTEEENPTEDRSSMISKLWWTNVWTQQLSEVNIAAEEEDKDSAFVTSETPAVAGNDVSKPASEHIQSEDIESEEENLVEVIPIPTEPVKNFVEGKLQIGTMEMDVPSNTTTFGDDQQDSNENGETNPFISSGLWVPIDNILTLGLASVLPSLRVSSKLRIIRKLTARVTGLHGVISGKPSSTSPRWSSVPRMDEDSRFQGIQRRLDDIQKASTVSDDPAEMKERQRRRLFRFGRRRDAGPRTEEERKGEELASERKRREEEAEEQRRKVEEAKQKSRRMERVKEIDRLIAQGQARLQHLMCEKDVLQRRFNPLYDYTSKTIDVDEKEQVAADGQDVNTTEASIRVEVSRKFKFPLDDLVEEYLDMIFSTRRIAKMNHTDLWLYSEDDEDEECIGDDLLTPSADAFKLYQDIERAKASVQAEKREKVGSVNGRRRGGGSWLLRQYNIGEKIGEVAETAAYKAVCAAVMSFLARLLSSLHGVNVMKHSDIRLVLEQAPDLPRIGETIIPGSSSDYAEETIKTVMRRKSKKGRKRSKYQAFEDSFVQRDAVTEMLLSHVQISAPLLKLFPLAWQRAFLGNIITLATAIMSDFFEGLQFQILGHSLTFSFSPITQEDMINHIGLSGSGFNSRRAKADEFEAAVRATAEDVSEELKFLDRWHERALGSGVLRTQIANLIARIVLTLTDEILAGARMDLWSAQAGGPRMLAGLEYRTVG